MLSISKDALVHADASGSGKSGTPTAAQLAAAAALAAATEAKKAGTAATPFFETLGVTLGAPGVSDRPDSGFDGLGSP